MSRIPQLPPAPAAAANRSRFAARWQESVSSILFGRAHRIRHRFHHRHLGSRVVIPDAEPSRCPLLLPLPPFARR
jgi:hypothetical protein